MSVATQLQAAVTRTSRLLDDSYPPELCLEARQRRRLDKLAEEVGEAVAKYGGMVGENPRKGQWATLHDVLEELLDVAACALGAYESLSGNRGGSVIALTSQAVRKLQRLDAAVGLQRGTE